jgi:ketosteroid isomerase-like protein
MQPAEKRMIVSESVLAAMRRTNELFNSEVIGKRNIDALDRIYTVQARILPPGAAMIQGREQIKEFWKEAIAARGVSSVTSTTVDAEPAGDGVIEIGRADSQLGGGNLVTAKYVVHWKQEDGEWKWDVDIWNRNE